MIEMSRLLFKATHFNHLWKGTHPMMMMSNVNIHVQENGLPVSLTSSSVEEATIKSSANERLQKIAKQLGKPTLSELHPISSSSQALAADPHSFVVLGASKKQGWHKTKFQDNQLINQLQAQVEQVTEGLKQLACTHQFEAETLRLFNKLHKAFQTNNTALLQRHWNSWLQVIELIQQQTTTLYGNTTTDRSHTVVASYFEPYSLPDWVLENAVPETEEALRGYKQFWLAQQQETAVRLQNAQSYSCQLQIKLENWLAAQTAPKSN